MWTKFSVEVLLLLALIPLPGPSLFKITCCRDNSRIVRKIVQSKFLPVLDKYNVKLGLECPFHPERDLFAPQQAAKRDRPSPWTCGVCGKSFYEEKYLDLHFEQRHKERINTAEDAICLSNYCDIMRCDVLAALDGTIFGNRASTDIEVWNEASARTAIATTTSSSKDAKKGGSSSSSAQKKAIRREATTNGGAASTNSLNNKSSSASSRVRGKCDRSRKNRKKADEDEEDDEEEEEDEDEDEDVVANKDSCANEEDKSPVTPLDRKQQRIAEMQRMKANCKKEELDVLRAKCHNLIRDCIGGLLIKLSQQEFKEMEDELNRKICWYLSCDRYWEDGPPDRRAFPWILLIVAASILSCGICLCYYIIWVLFDSDDYKFFMTNSSTNSAPGYSHLPPMLHQDHPSPTHSRSYASLHVQQNMLNNMILSETPSTSSYHPSLLEMNEVPPVATSSSGAGGTATANPSAEHYIYVTYPPELKRRLLESCYNRTTRL